MQTLRFCSSALVLFLFTWTISYGQEIDKNLIIGKWKFAKAIRGQTESEYKYNGDPLLTFDRNGKWITEDSNPKYRQSGSWKIENNLLIRDPEISGLGDIGPYTRIIEKLTKSDLVFSAITPEGLRTITFYFTRVD